MLRNGELGETSDDRNQKTVFLQDLKVIRMLFLVVGVFILCWGPHIIFYFLSYYKPHFNNSSGWSFSYRRWRLTTWLIIDTLPLSNSLCNPVIYACLDRTYRAAFKHLFHRMMCRRKNSTRQPSDAIELRLLRTGETSDCVQKGGRL